MQKIMFNNTYGLEEAVLSGTKTRTFRIVDANNKYKSIRLWQPPYIDAEYGFYGYTEEIDEWFCLPPKYKIGEVVAVAQSYKNDNVHSISFSESGKSENLKEMAGWNNKMFVKAEYMPHQIIITDIKQERLQDISGEDCMKEGIIKFMVGCEYNQYGYYGKSYINLYDTPREAFVSLIDKVSGKGIWDKNPWGWVYYFELKK